MAFCNFATKDIFFLPKKPLINLTREFHTRETNGSVYFKILIIILGFYVIDYHNLFNETKVQATNSGNWLQI